nr:bromo adjacent homology (BAH) domain, zinc finger, RING/FYVE/PHD-type [Tanacetum cinerariifolium]
MWQKKRELEFYTIKGTNKVIRWKRKAPYVACVERFVGDAKGNVNAIVEWYYRPEETIAGRKEFHGKKELFLSDQVDTQIRPCHWTLHPRLRFGVLQMRDAK